MHRIWLDCDTGVDDALALLLALRVRGCHVAGISTVAGNCPLEQATRNTLGLLALVGSTRIGVHPGAARALDGSVGDARHVHGSDGLGGMAHLLPEVRPDPRREPGHTALARALRRQPGQITVVATGPLTNLALLALTDPRALDLARELVIMGGAMRAPGNVAPTVEFNFGADPDAARLVLRGPWNPRLVGLDVTTQVRADAALRERVAQTPRLGPLAAGALGAYATAYSSLGAPLHDPLAMAAALDPSLLEWVQLPVDVEIRGELTRGALVADLRVLERPELAEGRPTARIARGVDAPRALTMLSEAWCARDPAAGQHRPPT